MPNRPKKGSVRGRSGGGGFDLAAFIDGAFGGIESNPEFGTSPEIGPPTATANQPYKPRAFWSRGDAARANADFTVGEYSADRDVDRSISQATRMSPILNEREKFIQDVLTQALKQRGDRDVDRNVSQAARMSPILNDREKFIQDILTQALKQRGADSNTNQLDYLTRSGPISAENTRRQNNVNLDFNRANSEINLLQQSKINPMDPNAGRRYTETINPLAFGETSSGLKRGTAENVLAGDQALLGQEVLGNTRGYALETALNKAKLGQADSASALDLQPHRAKADILEQAQRGPLNEARMVNDRNTIVNGYIVDKYTGNIVGTVPTELDRLQGKAPGAMAPTGSPMQKIEVDGQTVYVKAPGGAPQQSSVPQRQAPPAPPLATQRSSVPNVPSVLPQALAQASAPPSRPNFAMQAPESIRSLADFQAWVAKLPPIEQQAAMRVLYETIGDTFGIPKETYGSSTINKPYGQVVGGYLSKHPELNEQFSNWESALETSQDSENMFIELMRRLKKSTPY